MKIWFEVFKISDDEGKENRSYAEPKLLFCARNVAGNIYASITHKSLIFQLFPLHSSAKNFTNLTVNGV